MTSTTSKLLATAVCLLVIGCPPATQPPQHSDTWTRTFYGVGLATDLAQAPDGGFVVANAPDPFFGLGGYDLLKLNASGQEEWFVYDGGGQAVIAASQGGYVVCGPAAPAYPGFWITKFDANGDEHWSFRDSDDRTVACNDVCQTADGGYIVTGTYTPILTPTPPTPPLPSPHAYPILPESKAYDLHGRDIGVAWQDLNGVNIAFNSRGIGDYELSTVTEVEQDGRWTAIRIYSVTVKYQDKGWIDGPKIDIAGFTCLTLGAVNDSILERLEALTKLGVIADAKLDPQVGEAIAAAVAAADMR